MAIRWLETHVRENNRQEAPTREQLRKLDCLKDLDLFETMCKVLNIPMEVKKIWARKRLMPWFVAVPYVRTELQLRFAWCMMGLTRKEYDSEERKRSKEEKIFLMTNLRDLIVQEGAAVACAKRRRSLFHSVPDRADFSTCTEHLC